VFLSAHHPSLFSIPTRLDAFQRRLTPFDSARLSTPPFNSADPSALLGGDVGLSSDDADPAAFNGDGDDVGPPESWAQCAIAQCGRWRRVPVHIPAESLPDDWTCGDCHWHEGIREHACAAPQEPWPDLPGWDDDDEASVMSAKAVWNAWTHTWKKEAEEKKSGKRGHARDWLSG
jgi:hypothetical protein